MKTLAARNLGLGGKTGVAKAIAIAAPMVLLECHSGTPNPANARDAPITVVNIEAPAQEAKASAKGQDDGAYLRRKPDMAQESRALRTELNVDFYDGCVLRARLSVVNPDGSLDRIILDPKVDFSLEGANSSIRIPVCSQTDECNVSLLAGPSVKFSAVRGIVATFKPENGSGLFASSVAVPLAGPVPSEYCP